MRIKLISLASVTILIFFYINLQAKPSLEKFKKDFIPDEPVGINYLDTSRHLFGKLLWEGNIENGILGQPWPDPSNKLGNIWQSPNENSGPGKTYSDIVSESPAFGINGKKAIKMRMDLTPPNTKAGIRHFDNDRINNNPDHILTSWYYIPQLITDVGWGVMVMQWKQLTDNWTGNYYYSHANTAVYINSRNGQNYLSAAWLDLFWRSGGKGHGGSHPTKNIPIGEWFGIKARYTKSDPGVPNGRFTVWQIDLNGTHHLIADHKNVITYWDKDQNNYNARGRQLRAGIAWYAENAKPNILTAYADEVSIHLPKDPSEIVETSYTLNLQVSPSSNGTISGIATSSKHIAGAKVNLKAIPNSGFIFSNWTKDGQVIGSAADLVYTMPNQNSTLVANFQPVKYSLEVKSSSPEGGKVSIKGND